MAAAITELLAVRKISPSDFESVHPPGHMGNTANIAYGGNTLAVAINAALQTILPEKYFLYSALGNYLGPASTDQTLLCSVRSIRTTKTFATRHVEMSQLQKDGRKRLCLFLTADFHIQEPDSLLIYSRPPKGVYSSAQNSPTSHENRQNLSSRGLVDSAALKRNDELFGLSERFFDFLPCPESVMAQTMTGLAKWGTTTTQDHLPIYAKTSADYFRSKHPLQTTAEQITTLAFVMDMATSFLPLIHNGQSLAAAGTQSSLDFAFRIFTNEIDLCNGWCFRELSTITGAEGRTFGEARVWDEQGKRMLCSMTQQSILRPMKAIDGQAAKI